MEIQYKYRLCVCYAVEFCIENIRLICQPVKTYYIYIISKTHWIDLTFQCQCEHSLKLTIEWKNLLCVPSSVSPFAPTLLHSPLVQHVAPILPRRQSESAYSPFGHKHISFGVVVSWLLSHLPAATIRYVIVQRA